MKQTFFAVLILLFCSCGKKYNYVCTTIMYNNNGINTPPYQASMTEREARRYIRKHSKNDDGEPTIISVGEVQVDCVKQ